MEPLMVPEHQGSRAGKLCGMTTEILYCTCKAWLCCRLVKGRGK